MNREISPPSLQQLDAWFLALCAMDHIDCVSFVLGIEFPSLRALRLAIINVVISL